MVKDHFISWLVQENALYKEENVYYAEKAFLINAAVHWCGQQESINRTQLSTYMTLFKKYIKGELGLYWEDGALMVEIEKPTGSKKEPAGNKN